MNEGRRIAGWLCVALGFAVVVLLGYGVIDPIGVSATQTPALSLDKRLVSGGGFAAVGDVIQYAYDVTNSGNVTISGPITISDDKIATVSCPAGDLAPGAVITCAASYTVTQADLNNGSVTNIATAAGSFNSQPVTSSPDTVTVEALQEPALTLVKNAISGDPYAAAGDVVQYEYLVTNSGNVAITDPITVADDKTSVTCPALPGGALAPGGSSGGSGSYQAPAQLAGLVAGHQARNGRSRIPAAVGTAEGPAFSRKELDQLLNLAESGIKELVKLQKEALAKK